MKYRELLSQYQNQENIEKEALFFLIEETLKIKHTDLLLRLDEEIESIIIKNLQDKIHLYIVDNIPVQYIIGHTYFYGLKFFVNKNVLIPRFDTEILIDIALSIIRKNNYQTICDIGTGSGCIAITLKQILASIDMTAIDIDNKALEIAKQNALYHKVDIKFIVNDLLGNINEKYDCLIANPPYIDINEEVMTLVKNNEPHIALFSPMQGLYHYEQILKQSKVNLNLGGKIIFEVPANRDGDLTLLFKKYYHNIEIYKDYHQHTRIMVLSQE